MAYSLQGNQQYYYRLQSCFSMIPRNIRDINVIFFSGQAPFFFYLEKYFPNEAANFLTIYPYLQKLALNLNNILPYQIPILQRNQKNGYVILTRKQAALLFLLSFFNIMPNPLNRFCVYNVLMSQINSKIHFGRCFLNYLTIIGKWLITNNPILEENIIYFRNNVDNNYYLNNNIDLCDIQLFEEGSMFNEKSGYLVDFANKYIGGGTLTHGCVQEEILFAIAPEAIVSMLFMDVMDNNDAIGIINIIQYSKYKGYSQSFEFESSTILNPDNTKNLIKHNIIAIDAVINKNKNNSLSVIQYNNNEQRKDIIRDTHKAYVGFNLINFGLGKMNMNIEKTISTGNWGCGAFGGNHELKFFEQWIAASYAGVKRLDYYTFGDKKMKNIAKYLNDLKAKYKKAKDLYETISFIELDLNNLVKDLLQKKIN